MVAPAAAQIIHYPAKVVVDPTDLSTPGTDEAYGGTMVGKVQELGFQSVGEDPFGLWAECYGEVIDYLEGANQFLMGMLMLGYDDDAVAQFAPGGYTAGATTGHAKLTEPGSRAPGQSALEASNARDRTILILPEDTIHVPALILYRAVPDWTPAATIALERGSKFGLPLTFTCMRNASGNIYQWAMIDDMDLT